MSKWISTTEKLPKHNQNVMVMGEKGKAARCVFILCKHDEPFWSFPYGIKTVKPTHWMPMDDLPESCPKTFYHLCLKEDE